MKQEIENINLIKNSIEESNSNNLVQIKIEVNKQFEFEGFFN